MTSFVRKFLMMVLLAVNGMAALRAAETHSYANFESLHAELSEFRAALEKRSFQKNGVDSALNKHLGPAAPVTTRAGKLTIGGAVNVWYYAIQNDNRGQFDRHDAPKFKDTGEAIDNDSFRVRRALLRFTYELDERISAIITYDAARDMLSFPAFNANSGIARRGPNLNLANVQNGVAGPVRGFQDGFLLFKNYVPHHEFQLGQFKPWQSDEGMRPGIQLDFIERALITQTASLRDAGAAVHGTWFSERFQYWLGIYDGAANFHGSAGQQQNRSDDNDEKDFGYRVVARPVWQPKGWGRLEIGASGQFGIHGEASGKNPGADPVNGLNRNETRASKQYFWFSYFPGGPAAGFWVRAEWARFADRNAPGAVIDFVSKTQKSPKPFVVDGGYASLGYRFSESTFAAKLPHWLKQTEYAFRYESFDNVIVADNSNPSHTNIYKTQIFTSGINYYIQGNTKLQFNYNVVNNPDGNGRFAHHVHNDNFVMNFQVAF